MSDLNPVDYMQAQMTEPQVRPKVNDAGLVDINGLVRAAVLAEREACAKLADEARETWNPYPADFSDDYSKGGKLGWSRDDARALMAMELAAKIRARG